MWLKIALVLTEIVRKCHSQKLWFIQGRKSNLIKNFSCDIIMIQSIVFLSVNLLFDFILDIMKFIFPIHIVTTYLFMNYYLNQS